MIVEEGVVILHVKSKFFIDVGAAIRTELGQRDHRFELGETTFWKAQFLREDYTFGVHGQW